MDNKLPWKLIDQRITDDDGDTVLDMSSIPCKEFDLNSARKIVINANQTGAKLDQLSYVVFKLCKALEQSGDFSPERKHAFFSELRKTTFEDDVLCFAKRYLILDCKFSEASALKILDKLGERIVCDTFDTSGTEYWTSEDVEIAVKRCLNEAIEKMYEE